MHQSGAVVISMVRDEAAARSLRKAAWLAGRGGSENEKEHGNYCLWFRLLGGSAKHSNASVLD